MNNSIPYCKRLFWAVLCASAIVTAHGAAVTYTWSGAGEPNADGSLNWSNPANWGKTTAGDYPGKAKSDIATFPASTVSKVRIDVSKTIATLNANGSGLDLTFVRDEGCVLTLTGSINYGTENSKTETGSVITLDGAEISAGASTTYINTTSKLYLKNAASLKVSVLRMDSKYAYKEGLVELSGGSLLTVAKTGNTAFCLNDGGKLVIDDSTVDIKGYVYVNNQNAGGGRIVFEGAQPKMLVSGATFRSQNAAASTRGTDFDFLVPAEGWTEAPIQHLATTQAFLDGAPSCPTKMRFNVLPESPVFTSGLTADIPLIAATAGMKTSVAEFAPIRYEPSNYLKFSDDTTAVSLHVETTDHIVRVGTTKTESCGFPGPFYGYHTFAPGQATFTFTNATYAVGSTAVTGARVYSVDPETGDRTEIAGSPFAGDTFTCAVGAGMLDVVWEYGWTSAFANTVYVTPEGDDANDGTTWETAVASLSNAVAKAESGGIVFADGRYECINYPAAVSVTNPVTLASVNGRDVTELYFKRTANVRAMTLKHANAVLCGFALSSDKSTYGAGCLSMTAGLVTNCTIRGFSCARADSNGLAISLSGGTMSDCVMTNNNLYTSGGSGAWGHVRLTKAGAVVDRCVVSDNTSADSSGGNGAAVGLDAAGVQVRNTLIARNVKAGKTPGLYVVKGGIVDNCTIVSNMCLSATAQGGVYAASGAIIRNSIIYGNVNMNGEQNFTTLDAGAKLTNCCSTDDITGNGTNNVVAAPEFVDYDHGDYHLASGACINGGAMLDWMNENSIDLDGNPIGDQPEIGCYAYQEGDLSAAAVFSSVYGVDTLTVTNTASVAGRDKRGLVYNWYLTGGAEPDVAGEDKQSVEWAYNQPGVYTVRLVVTNAAGETSEAVYEDVITVSPNTVYVSKNSTPTRPYGSWETAADSVLDALKIAGDGTTIIVGDGVYTNDDTIIVTKDIRFVSLNGRDRTVMTRVKSGVKLLDVGCPTATVEGFTFRQEVYGTTMEYVAFTMRSGCITNCVFRDIYDKSYNGGYACFASLSGGLLVDCVIDHCHGEYRTSFLTGGGATIERCAFTNNDLAFDEYGGFADEAAFTFRNCLFAYNRSGDSMDIARGSIMTPRDGTVLENCTIVSNVIATAKNSTAEKMRPAVSTKNPKYAEGTVRNCIIWGNTNPFGVNDVTTSSKVTYTLSGNAELDGVDGNICADPKFYLPGSGKFRLRDGSPAVDAGQYQPWMNNAFDLNLNPRIYGADRGGVVDVGCYERIPVGFKMLVR